MENLWPLFRDKLLAATNIIAAKGLGLAGRLAATVPIARTDSLLGDLVAEGAD